LHNEFVINGSASREIAKRVDRERKMAPLIPSAKATLSYPLCACDFDPLDSTRLVVGGGGGAGRSGVGNKIVSPPVERC